MNETELLAPSLLKHLCDSRVVAENRWCPQGYKVNFDDIDPELRQLVSLVNQVGGMETLACCFGHPEDGTKVQNHHLHAFVDLNSRDPQKFMDFWRYVMSFTY